MKLADLDALIDSLPQATLILANKRDWFEWFRLADPAGAEVLEDGRLIYRKLPVLVVSSGASRVLSRTQALAEGYEATAS